MSLAALLSLSPAFGAPVEPASTIGQPAPPFSLPDSAGRTHSLAELRGRVVVLEWFNPDCPFVRHAYEQAPGLPALAAQAQGQGVRWLRINSGAPGKQGAGAERNQKAAADGSFAEAVLLDESGAVGRAYGARTTPQLVVIDASGVVRFNGALDNAPLGRVEGGARVPYAEQAVDAVRQGRPVPTASPKPWGCSVKYAD